MCHHVDAFFIMFHVSKNFDLSTNADEKRPVPALFMKGWLAHSDPRWPWHSPTVTHMCSPQPLGTWHRLHRFPDLLWCYAMPTAFLMISHEAVSMCLNLLFPDSTLWIPHDSPKAFLKDRTFKAELHYSELRSLGSLSWAARRQSLAVASQ